jgi:PEP-CTERM motif
MKRTLNLKKLTRHLLATSCLTVFAGIAGASTTYIESTDFPNSPPGTTLPVGTTEVQGTLSTGSDLSDWFLFTGLLPGGSFTISGVVSIGTLPSNSVQVWNAAHTVEQFSFSMPPGSGGGTVPGDGQLLVAVSASSVEFNGGYTIDLSAPLATPEPGTLATLGAGLIGAVAIRRRKK